MTPGPRCRGLVEAGALATAILLPLWFNPLAATPFEPYKVAFFGAVAVGVAAVCGACWAWRRYKARVTGAAPVAGPQERNPLLWPILAYVAILLLATALSVNPALSFWGRAVSPHGAATSLAQAAFFLAVAAALEGSEQIERLQAAIVLGTVPVALYGIAQHLGLDPIRWRPAPAWHPHSTMGSSLYLGAYLAMAIPFTLAGLARARERSTALRYALVLGLQALTLVLTRARSGWMACVAAVSLFVVLLGRRRLRRAALPMGGVLVGGVAVLAWMTLADPGLPLSALRSARGPLLTELRLASIPDRFAIWGGTLAMLPGRWLLGYGPDTYAALFPARCPPPYASQLRSTHALFDPHNVLLNHLFSAGVAGLAAYVLLLASAGRLALRILRHVPYGPVEITAAAAVCSAVAYLVYLQLNPDVVTLCALFHLDLALVAGAQRCHSRWIAQMLPKGVPPSRLPRPLCHSGA